MTIQLAKPTAREMTVAVICLALVLGAVFLAASLTQDKEIFRLTPPCVEQGSKHFPCNDKVANPDVQPEERLDLHRTFFTAWAALILVTPALCAFWFRRNSLSAARYWLAFWTISFLAFLVHLYWAVFVLFADNKMKLFNDKDNGGRVSAPYPDMLIIILWGIDVLLAWLLPFEGKWLRLFRILIHLAVFAVFFGGSALEGEICLSRIIGYVFLTIVLTSLIIWFAGWLKSRKTKAVPAIAGD